MLWNFIFTWRVGVFKGNLERGVPGAIRALCLKAPQKGARILPQFLPPLPWRLETGDWGLAGKSHAAWPTIGQDALWRNLGFRGF